VHEGFICYIWQFQYFDKKELKTSGGEKIEVFKPGIGNTHAGPDFSNAKVKIDGIDWVGSVEIHPRASGWMEHRHDLDPAYENVVLHVVWQNDQPIYRSDKTLLPTLELKDRVDESLITQYKKLVNTSFTIPCKKSFPQVEEVVKRSMLDRTLIQRLEAKAAQVLEILRQHHGDWQQTAFILLARNFGFNVNSDPFLQLAVSLSYKTLLKHTDKPLQIEALLFGQAGFLDIAVGDAYYQLLRREYNLLSQKYGLSARKLKRAQWRFLRLRPANFPTVRLAQFAALLVQEKNAFSKIFDTTETRSLRDLFSIRQSEYWQGHYQFNRKSKQEVAGLGDSSIDHILINTVAPLLVAYGKYNDQQAAIDRAVGMLQAIPSESNTITKSWGALGQDARTAFDSQAMIELYNNFCQRRNCLNCTIGASLLKPNSLT
jgi:hypothetical protein